MATIKLPAQGTEKAVTKSTVINSPSTKDKVIPSKPSPEEERIKLDTLRIKNEEAKIRRDKAAFSLEQAKVAVARNEERLAEERAKRDKERYKETGLYKAGAAIGAAEGGFGKSTALSMLTGGIVDPAIMNALGLDKVLGAGMNLAGKTIGNMWGKAFGKKDDGKKDNGKSVNKVAGKSSDATAKEPLGKVEHKLDEINKTLQGEKKVEKAEEKKEEGFLGKLLGFIGMIGGVILGAFKKAVDLAKPIISGVVSLALGALKKGLKHLPGLIWKGLKGGSSLLWKGAKGAGKLLWKGAKGAGKLLWKGAKSLPSLIGKGIKALPGLLKSGLGFLKTGLASLGHGLAAVAPALAGLAAFAAGGYVGYKAAEAGVKHASENTNLMGDQDRKHQEKAWEVTQTQNVKAYNERAGAFSGYSQMKAHLMATQAEENGKLWGKNEEQVLIRRRMQGNAAKEHMYNYDPEKAAKIEEEIKTQNLPELEALNKWIAAADEGERAERERTRSMDIEAVKTENTAKREEIRAKRAEKERITEAQSHIQKDEKTTTFGDVKFRNQVQDFNTKSQQAGIKEAEALSEKGRYYQAHAIMDAEDLKYDKDGKIVPEEKRPSNFATYAKDEGKLDAVEVRNDFLTDSGQLTEEGLLTLRKTHSPERAKEIENLIANTANAANGGSNVYQTNITQYNETPVYATGDVARTMLGSDW